METDAPGAAGGGAPAARGPGTTLRDFADHVSHKFRVCWTDDETPWSVREGVLRPLSPPHEWKAVDRRAVRKAMKETGARLAQWTEGWDTGECDWWYVCCDQKDYDLATLRKDPRYEVRKGLDQCTVRALDPGWFAENGYPVYAAAFARYGTRPLLDAAGFAREFLGHAEYAGRETWGAFVDARLVAWQSCIVVDDAVFSASSKSDPAFLKAKPNNALLYTLTRHYLRDRGVRYVTSGSRVLLHDTNAQEFKERMGYRKIYAPLRAELGALASLASSVDLPALAGKLGLRKRLGRSIEKLEALGSVARIARSCRTVPPGPEASPPTS